jgi:hypothetical protein
MSDNNTKRDYRVGYGRPPEHSRFKKGQSGNPSGRRRYTQTGRARQLMSQELFRRVPVREGDKVRHMPAVQALVRSLIVQAIKGKSAAAKEILTMLKILDEEALDVLDDPITKIAHVIVNPNQPMDLSKLSESEFDALERLLSKARPGGPQGDQNAGHSGRPAQAGASCGTRQCLGDEGGDQGLAAD